MKLKRFIHTTEILPLVALLVLITFVVMDTMVNNLRWYVLVYQNENFAYVLVRQLQAIFPATVLGSLFFVLLLCAFKLKNIYQAVDTLKDEMDAMPLPRAE